jgi:hypothetical protein
MSFGCLQRLLNTQTLRDAIDLIAKKQVKVVSCTKDDWKTLTVAQQKLAGENKLLVPLGYSVLQDSLHRSATILLRDMRKNGKSYLLGQDQGTYFGIELPGHPKNVGAAFKMLTPKIARVKGVQRQGEWFAVPVSKVPLDSECLTFSDGIGEIVLPVDDEESNFHSLSGVFKIGKDGAIYAKSWRLDHDQHNTIATPKSESWVVFVKNTAVRSVSMEGVD